MKKNQKKSGRKAKRTTRQQVAAFIFATIVKLSFGQLSVPAKINLARHIINMMTGNAYFPDVNPSLADIAAAADALELAQENRFNGSAAIIIRNIREKELDVLMSDVQAYVEYKAQGNPEIVLSAGMMVRDPKNRIGFLPATEWVRAKNAPDYGDVDLRWKAVRKSTGYRIEGSRNMAEGWPMVWESEKASVRISGLIPGEVYYFRIATLSRAGYDGYSEPIAIRLKLPV